MLIGTHSCVLFIHTETCNTSEQSLTLNFRPQDYLPNVIRGIAEDFLNTVSSQQPIFMFLALPSPHAPFTPEQKYRTR